MSTWPQGPKIPGGPVESTPLRDDGSLARALIESAPVAIYHTDARGNVQYMNPAYRRTFRLRPEQSADDWAQAVHPDDRARMERDWDSLRNNPRPLNFEYRTDSVAGVVSYFAEQVVAVEGASGFVGSITDVSEQQQLELELTQAHKLEAIGQLSAGIAHEINTPTQFIGDNVRFLQEAFGELLAVVQELTASTNSDSKGSGSSSAISAARAKSDFPYLLEEVPKAIAQSLEGIGRIVKIVGSMKEFSHPGLDQTPLDLNRAELTHQGGGPRGSRGVEVDGHSAVVARRHHLHRRVLQERRETHLCERRIAQGTGTTVQFESRGKRTPWDRHTRGRRGKGDRIQGTHSPGHRAEQFPRGEASQESKVLRN